MNSIHYNDQIVAQIFQRYSQTPAIVIYLSDHGQAVSRIPSAPTTTSMRYHRQG